MIKLPVRLLAAYMRGGWWHLGRCDTCGEPAAYAFARMRPSVPSWWPFPRVIRQCAEHFDPAAARHG